MFPCFRLTVSTFHTDCFHVSDSYTNIADGFRKANEMFDVSRGDRPAIRDLVVLITDGEANKEASKTITEVPIIAKNVIISTNGDNLGLTLSQRRKRWDNAKATLGQCLVFAGNILSSSRANEINRALGHFCAHTG